MPNKKTRPIPKTERGHLIDALLGTDEEQDEECIPQRLEAYGINSSQLLSRLKMRVEAEAQQIRSGGGVISTPMQNALKNLRSAVSKKSEAQTAEPNEYLNSFLAGQLPVSSSAQAIYSLRGGKPGQEVSETDKQILESLKTELEDEQG